MTVRVPLAGPTQRIDPRAGSPASLARCLLRAVVLTALGVPVMAGDWYVDALLGDDANHGQSPVAAWRTLSHALAEIALQPPDEHTLHVGPGTYDTAHGETFPLGPPPLLRIVGTQGSAATVIAGPTGVPFAPLLAYPGTLLFDARSGASGLTLLDAETGISVGSGGLGSTPLFEDLVVRGMGAAGISVTGYASPFPLRAPAHPIFRRVEIAECEVGIWLYAQAGSLGSASALVTLEDCLVRDGSSDGVRVQAFGNAAAHAFLERCRILRSGGSGILAETAPEITSARVTARATLVAHNQQHGLHGWTSGSAFGQFTLTDCTIAHNLQRGVLAESSFETQFRNCILAGNAGDLETIQATSAWYSNSQDGALLGLPGCIAADPLFVDPTGGDFRLAWGSPCIDSGDPASAGSLDLLGGLRPYDGDLDTVPAPDMGALEFRTLHLAGTPRIGAILPCESWGPAGAAVRLLYTRHPPVGPVGTPYGVLVLERALVQVHPLPALPGSGPLSWSLRVPLDPALVGSSFSFQTVTASAIAPFGAALGNPETFVVLP